MIWILISVVLAAISYFFVRNRPAAAALANVRLKKVQAENLSEFEKIQLAEDVRELAFAGYDRGSCKALEAGKSESFAHEIGVMDAVYCVLANDESARRNEALRPLLQMEGVPFNRLPPDLGRAAVAEYLVWKFFPDHADLVPLDEAMVQFTRALFRAVEREANPDGAIYQMIYSKKYDWQALAVQHVPNASGGKNG